MTGTENSGLFRLIDPEEDMPSGADAAVIADAADMAPFIKKGDRVYISRRAVPENGEVGLFFCRDRMVIRQYCEDSVGNIYLFCADRQKKNGDIVISPPEKVYCFGKVLLKDTPPLPEE